VRSQKVKKPEGQKEMETRKTLLIANNGRDEPEKPS
jgi:hypothetical protein